jgi:hypothetical protein
MIFKVSGQNIAKMAFLKFLAKILQKWHFPLKALLKNCAKLG